MIIIEKNQTGGTYFQKIRIGCGFLVLTDLVKAANAINDGTPLTYKRVEYLDTNLQAMPKLHELSIFCKLFECSADELLLGDKGVAASLWSNSANTLENIQHLYRLKKSIAEITTAPRIQQITNPPTIF